MRHLNVVGVAAALLTLAVARWIVGARQHIMTWPYAHSTKLQGFVPVPDGLIPAALCGDSFAVMVGHCADHQ